MVDVDHNDSVQVVNQVPNPILPAARAPHSLEWLAQWSADNARALA
jgi:hypothetical protein